ncbi:MAG TPA: hypothetical protein VK530_09455 [Candidatus Acidoferrum sp.]|nr:hypothetical protein [Candidatus Acidoferrum sp.]
MDTPLSPSLQSRSIFEPQPMNDVNPSPAPWRRRRNAILALMIGLAVISGAVDVIWYDHHLVCTVNHVIGTLVLSFLVMLWCVYDSRLRNFPLPSVFRLFILLVGLVGVPLYFCRSRGPKERLRSAFGLFLLLAAVAPYYAGWYLTIFVLTAFGYYGNGR